MAVLLKEASLILLHDNVRLYKKRPVKNYVVKNPVSDLPSLFTGPVPYR